MITNKHILSTIDRIGTAKQVVRNMTDSCEKVQLLALLDNMCELQIAASIDVADGERKIAELSKCIYEPVIYAQGIYPAENDYNAVREYVEGRKKNDPIFKQYCNVHNRAELCKHLSDEFGWPVDVKSYGRNLQRH